MTLGARLKLGTALVALAAISAPLMPLALIVRQTGSVGVFAALRMSPTTALFMALAIGLAATVMFVWLKRSALQPLLDLARAMEQFAAGNLKARSEERGGRELRSMARTFNDMAAELSRVRTRQIRYLAGIVHDLRTPLSTVQLALGLLAPQEIAAGEPRLQRLVLLIEKQIARMAAVVGDILNEAKIQTGELDLRFQRVDVRQLAGDVVELFQFLTPTHRINLEVIAEPIELVCDSARLEQILGNLLSNAVKFSPAGSSVSVRVARSESGVWLQVSDEGGGIAIEQLPRIYEPSFSIGPGAERMGVALGLFCTKRLVEAHGGRIQLHSRLGGGTSFRVFFPTRGAASSRLIANPVLQPRTALG